jgi:aryl-alcohol dehydrogenase-like predicted oxidoreductase
LLCKHDHVVPIPGTRRIRYLEQNAGAANVALTAAEISELDVLFAPERISGDRYQAAGMLGIE